MIRYIRTHARGVAAAAVAAAVLGGGAFAYAVDQPAGPTVEPAASLTAQTTPGSPTPGAPGAAGRARGLRRLGGFLAIGRIVSVDPASDGTGRITLQAPDGKTFTGRYTAATRVFRYHGPGDHPTRESIGDLKAGEIIAVRGAHRADAAPPATALIALVVDTGFSG